MNDAQRKLIFGLATELGLKDSNGSDDLHALIWRITGRDSLKKLDDGEAAKVIIELRQIRSRQSLKKRRPGKATEEMLFKQRQLAGKMGWNEDQLGAFIKRMARVDRPEWQSQTQASNVIEGLKKILARQEVKAGGAAAPAD